MSNLIEARPRVKTITLNDGIEREIKLTLNAMAELEDRYGSVEAAFNALDNNSIKAVRCVLWAMMLDSDENLTEQQVGKLIDVYNMKGIMESLSDAILADMPEQPADDSGKVVTLPNA